MRVHFSGLSLTALVVMILPACEGPPTRAQHTADNTVDENKEPGGYQPLVHFDGSQMPPRGFPRTNEGLLALNAGPGATTGDNGGWDSPPHELIRDSSAPVDDRLLRVHFPAGKSSALGYFNLWGPTKDVLNHLGISRDRPHGFELREMYYSAHVRLTSGRGDGTWEMGRGLKLLGYIGFAAPSPASNLAFPFTLPTNFSSMRLIRSAPLEFVQQGPGSVPIEERAQIWNYATVHVDQWHHFELIAKLNDIGSANGVLKIYLDGVKKVERRDMIWRTKGHPKGFTVIHVDQVFGDGRQLKTRTDFVDIDDIYVSGLELLEGAN